MTPSLSRSGADSSAPRSGSGDAGVRSDENQVRSSVAIVSAFPPPIGGVTIHASRMAERLEAMGWSVHRIDTGVPRGFLGKVSSTFRTLFEVLERRGRGVELFHFHSSKGGLAFLTTAPVLRFLGARIVLSLHSGELTSWLKTGSTHAKLVSKSLPLADLVVTMNESLAGELRAILDAEDRPTIRAATPFVAPTHAPVRRVSHDDGRFRITTMGLWKPLYGFEEAIAAAERASDLTDTEILLDLVVSTGSADTEYRERIMNDVARPRLNLRIRILEDVAPTRIFDYLASRDLLIRSSRVDSYGMCVAEALSVRTPVIATNVCRRPAGADIYAPGDVDRLTKLIVRRGEKSEESSGTSGLEASEDAAVTMDAWYRLLLAGDADLDESHLPRGSPGSQGADHR